MLRVSDAWRAAYPGAAVGILAMRGVANPPRHAALDAAVAACETELRGRLSHHDRPGLRALPAVQPYAAHYGRFGKTYHVLLQLESVVLKGKGLPRGPALVAAMVMAELGSQLLTAGHDLAAVEGPLVLDVATGRERYALLSSQEQETRAGDMLMADARGVISSVLYGPDRRTRLVAETREALFVVYAPAGVGAPAVAGHLEGLRQAVLLVAPGAETETQAVHGAG